METQLMIQNPTPLSLDIFPGKLSRHAEFILLEALSKKSISTDEISALFISENRKGKIFVKIMEVLSNLFKERNVTIYYRKSEVKKVIVKPISKEVQNISDELRGIVQAKKVSREPRRLKPRVIPDLDATFDFLDVTNSPAPSASYSHQDDSTFNWFMKECKNYKLLSKEEIYKLIPIAQSGNTEARNMIMMHNERLVVSIAKRYNFSGGLELMDLIQEGNIGLIKAIDKFDISLEIEFSTYAFQWIRQSITRALSDLGSIIRIPVHVLEDIQKLKTVTRSFQKKFGRKPTNEEVFIATAGLHNSAAVLNEVSNTRRCISFDSPIGSDDESYTIGDTIADDQTTSGITRMEIKEELARRKKIIHTFCLLFEKLELSDRNKEVFCMYFRLNGKTELHNMESIGEHFNLSRERIRQITNSIWKKLKCNQCPLTEQMLEDELEAVNLLESIVLR